MSTPSQETLHSGPLLRPPCTGVLKSDRINEVVALGNSEQFDLSVWGPKRRSVCGRCVPVRGRYVVGNDGVFRYENARGFGPTRREQHIGRNNEMTKRRTVQLI